MSVRPSCACATADQDRRCCCCMGIRGRTRRGIASHRCSHATSRLPRPARLRRVVETSLKGAQIRFHAARLYSWMRPPSRRPIMFDGLPNLHLPEALASGTRRRYDTNRTTPRPHRRSFISLQRTSPPPLPPPATTNPGGSVGFRARRRPRPCSPPRRTRRTHPRIQGRGVNKRELSFGTLRLALHSYGGNNLNRLVHHERGRYCVRPEKMGRACVC